MEKLPCSRAKDLVLPVAHDFPTYPVAWVDLQSSYSNYSSKEQNGGERAVGLPNWACCLLGLELVCFPGPG